MKSKYNTSDKGALFKNEDKQSETHPDYKGSINVGGVDYWISAWLNQSKAGQKYMSLSVKQKEQRQAKRAEQPPPPSAQPEDFDDSIPF